MTTHVHATAQKEAAWWFIEIPELNAYGQSATLAAATSVAKDLAALALDLEPDDIEVTLTVNLDTDAKTQLAQADALAAQAAELARASANLRAGAVQGYLARNHVTRREAAVAFGLSVGRVQQLASMQLV